MESRATWRDEPAGTLVPHLPSVAGALDLIASRIQIGQILVDGIALGFNGEPRIGRPRQPLLGVMIPLQRAHPEAGSGSAHSPAQRCA